MNKQNAPFVLGFCVFVLIGALVLWNPLQVIQWKLTDLFFINREVSDEITIIGIDDYSRSPEANLGPFRDWPREYYARLLDVIKKYEPAVVAFDLQFPSASKGMSEFRIQQILRASERGENVNWYNLLSLFEPGEGKITHPDDVAFQEALDESTTIIMPANLIVSNLKESNSVEPLADDLELVPSIFSGENIVQGYSRTLIDRDGVLRRFQPRFKTHNHFSTAIYEAFVQNQSSLSLPQEPVRINYTGAPFEYRKISFADILTGQFNSEHIQGKIVLVGVYSTALQDFRETPTDSQPMFGVEIHANIIQQLIEGRMLGEMGKFATLLLVLVLSIGGALLFMRLSLRAMLILFGAGIVFYPTLAFAAHQIGYQPNVVYPVLAWAATFGGALWYRNVTEFKEKRQITDAFSHYVSPVIVQEIAKNPENLQLGGKRQRISIMFSDIVGFTSISEKLSPEETVALLNSYLDAMSEVIFGFQGTLDKFQGDAIMAMFGAPLHDDHRAVNACHTALGMRKVLANLHERWNQVVKVSRKELLTKLDFRVGIATGDAVIGNVGSKKRFDYTAIGDIVNLGSRLESINRKYGTQVIVDKNTFTEITSNHNPFIFRKLDMVRVKGKEEVTEIFELVALKEQLKEDMKTMLDDFENGRILYTQRNFAEAKQYFEAALNHFPHDGPSSIYLNRCAFFIRKPPARTWDAVVDMEEK